MAVTETLRAIGSWDLSFKGGMRDELWKKIDYFGHIVIVPGRRPSPLDDSLLRTARYVGPVTKISDSSEAERSIGGSGMAMWLGDGDGKGDVFSDPITVTGDYDDVIRALLPASGAVTEGTFFSIAGTWPSSTFQFQTPRDVIDYVAQTIGAAWRVNGDATLDFGLESDLFVVNPTCIVARKAMDDMFLRGLYGNEQTERDVEDYSTGIVLLGQGINGQFVSAEEELDPSEIPFVDMHGNKVRRLRIIQESETDPANAPARALLQLNRFKGTRDALTLTTSDYDIKGKAQVGDYVWVFDESMDLVDYANEVPWRGQRINPFKLRMTETTWPITSRMGVLFRTGTGEWLDLSKNFVPENGETTLVVGGYNRSLTADSSSGTFPITLPDINTTVPNAPTWNTPFIGGVYQSPSSGETKAEVILDWNRPTNTDASTMTDGDHYDIRYRQSSLPFFPVVWDQVESTYEVFDNWEASGATLDYPLLYDISAEWQAAAAPFDTETFRLQELTPGMPYEAQIRAVDNGKPANASAWSALTLFQAINDNIPPAVPAPPDIQANPMAVLMTHNLGRSDGGTFNLDRDLHHLELHGGPEPLFVTTDDTLVGKVLANYGMMVGQIPLVASFQITSLLPIYFKVIAVDEAGNKSAPSTAVGMVAGLITNQYIQSLTAAKITAGTMSASVIVGGRIATMQIGDFPGVELTSEGIEGWNISGFRSLFWDTATGRLHVNGTGGIEIKDGNLTVLNAAGTKIVEVGECTDGRHGIQVYTDAGVRVARMGELASGAEGIEVISDTGDLVRVDTLAFGTRAASVATQEGTSSSSYVNLATVGPFVTVPIGNSGRCVVILSSRINGPGTSVTNATVGFDIAGPSGYFAGANIFNSLWVAFADAAGNLGVNVSLSKAVLVTGLPNPGNYTVQMKYAANGTTHNFQDRHIVAIPF